MSKHEKLLKRFLTRPRDFTFDELKKFLNRYDYIEFQGDGSRVAFVNVNDSTPIHCHRPHGKNPYVNEYTFKQIEAF